VTASIRDQALHCWFATIERGACTSTIDTAAL